MVAYLAVRTRGGCVDLQLLRSAFDELELEFKDCFMQSIPLK